MKEIPLTKGMVAIVDDDVYEWASAFKWYAHKSRKVHYAVRNSETVNGKRTTIKLHREIMGVKSKEILVDHKDRNGLNNQRENLRLATQTENSRNSVKCKTSKTRSEFKGVAFRPYYLKSKFKNGRCWRATITVDKKKISLGSYCTELEAHQAYCDAAKKYFGEFARTE